MTEIDTSRESVRLMLKGIGSTPFPDDLQPIVDDACSTIATLLARAEKAEDSLSQMRDAVAEIEGLSKDWPQHGNIPIAIVSGYSLHKSGWKKTEAEKDVLAERERQQDVEGWTAEHDDEHDPGEISAAGSAYALNAACLLSPYHGTPLNEPPEMWPWDRAWWKPDMGANPRHDLVKAGALILAEIERLDRSFKKEEPT